MAKSRDKILKELRDYGLALPGAHLKSPWPGHKDLAVNDKTFAYLSVEGEPFGISCKLPSTSAMALMLPFTSPTPYGLGKSGWVSANFEKHEPSVEMLKAWIDESYRAQAPKKLLKSLEGGTPTKAAAAKSRAATATKATTKRATKPKPATHTKPEAATKTKSAPTGKRRA